MTSQRAIDIALDLSRMPALAPSMAASPLPSDVDEVIRIAGESSETCRAAALITGKSEAELVAAARFYLQQVLFRDETNCYRVLGLPPEGPRDAARTNMRWLLRWLHPDRNRDWDSVYAKRVVNAWREISRGAPDNLVAIKKEEASGVRNGYRRNRHVQSFRLPWIARPYEKVGKLPKKSTRRSFARLLVKGAAALAAIFLLIVLTAPASTFRALSELITDPFTW